MLILTLSDTSCSAINVTSTVSDYSEGDIATIDITASINCCTDSAVTYQITDFVTPDSLLVDIDGTLTIQLTPEFFSTTDTLNDGIYSIKIRTTKDDTSYVEESACIFVDCYVKCKVADLVEDGDYEAHRIYESIQMATACPDSDCDCSASCKLFEQLVNKLEISTTNGNSINDCGCS